MFRRCSILPGSAPRPGRVSRSHVENLWMDSANPVENMTRKKFVRGIGSNLHTRPRVERSSRPASLDRKRRLRRIATRFTSPDINTRDSSSLHRNDRRAGVSDRGHARQQPMARATLPHAGPSNGNDAVLRNHSRRSRSTADQVAHTGAWRAQGATYSAGRTGARRDLA